jgi:integrase
MLRPRTTGTYAQILRLFESEGGDVAGFLAARRPATQRTYHRHLNVFFRWQIKQGWARENPCDAVALPRTPLQEPTYFTRDEIDRLVETIEATALPREKAYLPAMIRFVCETGPRLSEVCACRWSWVQGHYLVLRARDGFRTKSGRDERVYMTTTARDVLDGLQKEGEGLFQCPTRMQVSKRFLHWRRLAELDHGSFHSVRHTCASWMAMNGVSPYVVKEHLRHSTVSVAERYMHLSPSNWAEQLEAGLRCGGTLNPV